MNLRMRTGDRVVVVGLRRRAITHPRRVRPAVPRQRGRPSAGAWMLAGSATLRHFNSFAVSKPSLWTLLDVDGPTPDEDVTETNAALLRPRRRGAPRRPQLRASGLWRGREGGGSTGRGSSSCSSTGSSTCIPPSSARPRGECRRLIRIRASRRCFRGRSLMCGHTSGAKSTGWRSVGSGDRRSLWRRDDRAVPRRVRQVADAADGGRRLHLARRGLVRHVGTYSGRAAAAGLLCLTVPSAGTARRTGTWWT